MEGVPVKVFVRIGGHNISFDIECWVRHIRQSKRFWIRNNTSCQSEQIDIVNVDPQSAVQPTQFNQKQLVELLSNRVECASAAGANDAGPVSMRRLVGDYEVLRSRRGQFHDMIHKIRDRYRDLCLIVKHKVVIAAKNHNKFVAIWNVVRQVFVDFRADGWDRVPGNSVDSETSTGPTPSIVCPASTTGRGQW
jgi:hypothetical protein